MKLSNPADYVSNPVIPMAREVPMPEMVGQVAGGTVFTRDKGTFVRWAITTWDEKRSRTSSYRVHLEWVIGDRIWYGDQGYKWKTSAGAVKWARTASFRYAVAMMQAQLRVRDQRQSERSRAAFQAVRALDVSEAYDDPSLRPSGRKSPSSRTRSF